MRGIGKRPGKLLKEEGIDSFLNYYVQSILIYLSDILKRNGETEIK